MQRERRRQAMCTPHPRQHITGERRAKGRPAFVGAPACSPKQTEGPFGAAQADLLVEASGEIGKERRAQCIEGARPALTFGLDAERRVGQWRRTQE